MSARRVLLAAAATSALCWSLAVRADFADGLRAFDGGDYAAAFAEWQPLAEAGDAAAQVALAGLYLDGLGVRRDVAEAVKWYERAARQGHLIAQANLGDFYARGRGVQRDLVEAYVWLSLAARQGHGWSEERRNEIVGAMTDEQIAAADDRLRAWLPDE
jgi:hypothetical protein